MDIHIQIPEYALPMLQTLSNLLDLALGSLRDGTSLVSHSVSRLWEIPRNAYLPILAVLLVFWPVVLSVFVAFASASTWIFWLFTSVMFGLLQLLYVTYQFMMIALDIMGLSVLKTYSMIRNSVLNMVDKTSGTSFGKSRRRLWREKLEKCGTYENFLKIRIEAKDESTLAAQAAAQDPALPPTLKNSEKQRGKSLRELESHRMPRAQSFSDDALPPSPSRLPRASSFNGKPSTTAARASPILSPSSSSSPHSSLTIDIDPVVIQELGQKTADLLARTTERLNEARIQAERNASDEAIASLKYLVAAVVKRNHLQLDSLVIDNARSIAGSGQYGLTSKSRNLIRSYYAEVEKCLDWLADSPLPESSNAEDVAEDEEGWLRPNQELLDRIKLVRKMKQNMGRTALMLSGGGAQVRITSCRQTLI